MNCTGDIYQFKPEKNVKRDRRRKYFVTKEPEEVRDQTDKTHTGIRILFFKERKNEVTTGQLVKI